ncbi:UNVERIFIED_CONTAM: hypothetical protein HDU68_002804 [Siphonaria sp. JEL0065]|nr:hypothetical protein HDU68_002804 [Siphonaria sp. JEL0065]
MNVASLPSLANKNQTTITIGLINWYCYLPAPRYDGSWAYSYPEAYDPNYVDLSGPSGSAYLIDASASAAVWAINHNPDILPYTTVKIKRFSDCGGYWPEVIQQFSGQTTGFAMSEMAITDIGDIHKDVIGVVGTEYSTVAQGTAEVLAEYQVPYCATSSAAPSLSDKLNFPYFFRLISSSGLGNYVYALLDAWNVKRIAIISQSDDLMSRGLALDVFNTMKAKGVAVVSQINLKGMLTHEMVMYAKLAILRSEARYIFISGQTDFISKVYWSLALEDVVGKKYVYMSVNAPQRIATDMSLLSSKLPEFNNDGVLMAPYAQGYITFSSMPEANPNPPWINDFYNGFANHTQMDLETREYV